jgi:hypothetical protein
MTIYTGYIYLWYDTRAKLFYLGGHKGKVEDSYICSNKMMLRAYRKRPETFKLKILEYVNGDNKVLREAEQRWLNLIHDKELYWTPNIYNKTVKYYNQKKQSSGGNGSANKGKSRTAWNKGLSGVQPYTKERNLKISQSKVKHPLREFNCPICQNAIKTRIQSKKTCSNSCKMKLRNYTG